MGWAKMEFQKCVDGTRKKGTWDGEASYASALAVKWSAAGLL